MARKFLYVFAALIVLVIAGAVTYRIYGVQLMQAAMVPNSKFVAPKKQESRAYEDKAMWIARPDLPGNPALWLPRGVESAAEPGAAAIFFIHPTSYITMRRSAQWNAALDDKETNTRAAIFVRGQARVFNAAGEVWAPRYRQANFGAFLTTKPEGLLALEAAYFDVATAFDRFVASIPKDKPIIVAGHSQGALHLTRLLKDKVAGAPIAQRLVAAYVIGWPVSAATDLGPIGMPACTAPDETGCLLSWQTFAEPADTTLIEQAYNATTGFDGQPRKDTAMVCTNPVTGTERSTSQASANLGTLKNKADFSGGELIPAAVGARCDERGFLLIGDGPDLGPYTLPGNNYHVYDFSLFWANIRADALRRLEAFAKK
jgi:Protein of unknown function (DUF3089)